MGDPCGDISRLREVLELCSERGLKLVRLKVADVELTLLPSPATAPQEARPTIEELEQKAKREFVEIMYAGSFGDIPEVMDS